MTLTRLIPAVLAAGLLAAPAAAADGALTPEQRAEVEALVRDYILKNPEIILESMAIMEARQRAEQEEQVRLALASRRAELEDNPADPVLGNPDGDVVIVEFFDYQCGYCKTMLKPLMSLLADDGGVKLVMKEFPILGEASVVAAKASLAAGRQGRYEDFHNALMGLRGRLSEQAIWQVARETGLDLPRLEKDMADPAIEAQIQETYKLAQALTIQGTPAFTIGDRLIPGAVPGGRLAELVAERREGG